MKSLAVVMAVSTCERFLMLDNIGVVKFFHDVDLLINILLQEWFLFEVDLADDLDCIELINIFYQVNI